MVQDTKRIVSVGEIFPKIICPLWLTEIRIGAAAPDDADAPPRKRSKKSKNRAELQQGNAARQAALGFLTADLFLTSETRTSRRAGAGSGAEPEGFKWLQTATRASDREAMKQQWSKAGVEEHFSLFHTGSNKPLRVKQ